MLDNNSSLLKKEFLCPMKGSVIIEIESTKGFFFDFFNTFAIYDFKGTDIIAIG